MVEPKRPTQRYIESWVAFHESGARWYAQQNESNLAAWSREQAALWRAKLEPVKGREPGADE